MLFSKNTINSKDWIDVIFAGRNKEYGAYQLRQYSNKAINIALAIVVFSIAGVCSLSFAKSKTISKVSTPIDMEERVIEVEIDIEDPIVVEPIQKEEAPAQVAQDVSAKDLMKFTEINPSPKSSDEDVASVDVVMDKKVLLASMNLKGTKGGELITNGTFGKAKRKGGSLGNSIGDPSGDGIGNTPFEAVEIMPLPPGGMEAFVKWVGQNYKYSESAIQNEAKGLVQITFVVERDGSLSSFDIKKDIGYGTGEEAIRLLQKAKKWSPGVQNGRTVRVSYTLPIRLSTISY